MMKRLLAFLLLLPCLVHAAAPTVSAVATTSNSSDSTTQTLTLATITAGETQLCALNVDYSAASSVTNPAGWTELNDELEAGDLRMVLVYRTMTGAEASTIDFTTDAAEKSTGYCISVAGSTGTPTSATPVHEAGAVQTIDPPAISGLTSGDYLFVALAGWDQWKPTFSAYPTGYSGTGDHVGASASGNTTLAYGYKGATTVTGDDPSAFTITDSGDQALAFTVAFAAATGDVTAPVLTSPTVSGLAYQEADLAVTTDEGNGTLYYVVTDSATAPSATRVKSGQDAAGDAALASGSVAVSSTGTKTFSNVALTDNLAGYYAYFMHEDANGNKSTVSSAAVFSTPYVQLSTTPAVQDSVVRNELKWSNGFGNAAWVKTATTYAFSEGAGPGGRDAWLITRSTGTSAQFKQAVTGSAGTYTLQTKAKIGSAGGYAGLRIQGTYPARGDALFDLSTGALSGSATASGTATNASASITEDEDGYYLLTLTVTLADAITTVVAGPASSGATVTGWEGSSGIASNAYFAEAQLENAATAGPYVETERTPLSSNQAAVRVVSDYNAIIRSNNFSVGDWSINRLTNVTNTLTLGDGRTLYQLNQDTQTGAHYIYTSPTDQLQLDPAGLVTIRVVAAWDGVTANQAILINAAGDASNNFRYGVDLTQDGNDFAYVSGTGTVHSIQKTLIETIGSKKVWEVIVRGWPSTTSRSVMRSVEISGGLVGACCGAGVVGVGPYIGYVRAVQGYTISDSDVVTTGAAELPLASAINAATVGGEGVAVGGTNLQTYSNAILSSNAGWTDAGGGDLQELSTAVTAPFPSALVYRLYEGTATQGHSPAFTDSGVLTTVLGQDYYFGILLSRGGDAGTYRYVQLNFRSAGHGTSQYANFDLDNGVVTASAGGTARIQAFNELWWFAEFTAPATASAANSGAGIAFIDDNPSATRYPSYAGNSKYIYAAAPRLTVGVPSDVYIETSATPIYGRTKTDAVIEYPVLLSDFVSGGDGEALGWSAADLVLTDGSSTHTGLFDYTEPAETTDSYVTAACNSASCPDDSVLNLNFGSAVIGDELFCRSNYGGVTVSDYGVPTWTTSPAQVACRLFDVSVPSWSAVTTDSFTEEDEQTCAQLVRDAWRATIRTLAKEPICRSLR